MKISHGYLFYPFIFMGLASICQSDISAKVIISNWTLPGDKLAISCSVNANINSEKDVYNVHLLCPFVDGTSCYVNCNGQCIVETGECINIASKGIFYSCNYVRSQKNKIDLYYQLNIKNINIKGQWLCQYGGIRSTSITIDKYLHPLTTSTKPSFIITTTALPTSLSTSKSTMDIYKDSISYFELKIIILIIISLGVSISFNVVLIIIIFVTRKNFQKRKRKLKKKDDGIEVTETTSTITRSSIHHQILNRSNCSRTPSLDSPSFRESIANFIPEGSANTNGIEPRSFYKDQCGRVFGVIHSINNIPLDSSYPISRQSADESQFRPMINGNILLPPLVQAYGPYMGSWAPMTSQNHDLFQNSRSSSSQQQIYHDSSGIGSQSLSNSSKEKVESFRAVNGAVDFMVGDDSKLNNIAQSPIILYNQA